ncbi:hypothetical protein [Paraburkholderia sp. DHOC27]|uniref:hypothetical protein n=1 Tax=Paraburkholderia sp. DHOC27 TaxID=2303330 RepID=UPI000E3DC98A|nr:hypothetical protein [Paraburkholderia sp. DHOC27]RFU44652.1 hypothetical protein D0B32_26500 [Paraburkholderia sp. DHOC27]
MTADRYHPRAPSRHGPDHRTVHQPQLIQNARDRRTARDTPSSGTTNTTNTTSATISAPRTLFALLVAPLAWLAQVAMAELVLERGCHAAGPMFLARSMPWTPLGLGVASLVCLVFAVAGAALAWRNLWRTAQISWRFPAALKGTRAERDWFLSRVSALSGTMFVLGLLATDVAMLLIAPCGLR